jgi:hypothetical protein
MTDIQGLRAQLRDSGPRPAAVRVASSGGGVPFWAIAIGAAVIGFGIVLLAPRVFTAQRTAALPVFHEAGGRTQAADSGQAPSPERVAVAPAPSAPLAAAVPPQSVASQPTPAPAAASRYAGKAPEEVVRLSDSICEQRSQAVRNGGQPQRSPKQAAEGSGNGHKVTAADEKLYCLLVEAPPRFCAPNQKRKIAADIINYFKGIEYTNAAVAMAAKVGAVKQDAPGGLNKAEIDPGVVEAIDGLIRAGYLTMAQRDEIGANLPRELKDRFARIVGSTPRCPKPPWWASFL